MTIKRQNWTICRSQTGPVLRQSGGFTLVELMITMVIFVLAIAAASQIFVGLLNQFKQQSKIAETNIEGIIGLEMLRADIQQAGFGLPWNMNAVTYCEAIDDGVTPQTDTNYNDTNTACTVSNPPRALVIGPGEGLNGSDILVVKATNVATNATAHKSTYITQGAAVPIKVWGSAQDDLVNTDYVIAIQQVDRTNGNLMVLLSGATGEANGGFQFIGNPAGSGVNGLAPTTGFSPPESNLIFGVSPNGSPPRMPFNRADYYIRTPAAGMPTRCAPGTGVLYKATVNHADGGHSEMPLLDCVADMRVVVAQDTKTPRDGNPNFFSRSTPPDALTLRNTAIDVRVYIVAHEGQRDTSYTYVNQSPVAGCAGANMVCINDSSGVVPVIPVTVPDVNYRWKLYTLVAKPYFSLR